MVVMAAWLAALPTLPALLPLGGGAAPGVHHGLHPPVSVEVRLLGRSPGKPARPLGSLPGHLGHLLRGRALTLLL